MHTWVSNMHEVKDLGQFGLMDKMCNIWMHNKNLAPVELNISQLQAHAVLNQNKAER